MDLKSGSYVGLDNISDEFEGQSHRSKAKIIRLKKRDFLTVLLGGTCVNSLS